MTPTGISGRPPGTGSRSRTGAAAGRPPEATELLNAWANGSDEAGDQLAELLYPSLRRQAAALLHRGWPDVSLQVTELLNEAFLRLAEQRHIEWRNREHFLAMATCFIRRCLLNHARDRRAQKRGPGIVQPLGQADSSAASEDTKLLLLDLELRRLATIEPTAARVVELRHFGGLSVEETAKVLKLGRATVVRKWRAARTWLRAALSEDGRLEL